MATVSVRFDGIDRYCHMDATIVPRIGEKVIFESDTYLVVDLTHTIPDQYIYVHTICVKVEKIK